MNNNIGCFGWCVIIFIILMAITYWQVSLVVILIGAGIWWYTHKSQHAIEKQKEQAKIQEKQKAERQKKLEQYANMDLKSIAFKDDIINLKPTEYIYYCDSKSQVTWREHRQKTTRVNYGGLTGNIKIFKGLHYRMGSLKTELQKEGYLKTVFTGYPLLTNRRIVLYNTDTQTAKAYPYTRLLTSTAYSDGTVLSSESGKNVILTGFSNPDEFNVFLQRLTSDENVLPEN